MIRIITDSAADITREQARRLGVEVVPLSITFPSIAYDQAADEDFSRFYALLESEKTFPTTSQPAPAAFARAFERARDAGDSVVCVLISSGLSGTVQSARIARDTVGYDAIHIIDSRSAIMPLRILVEHAAALAGQGLAPGDIVRQVEALSTRVQVFGMLDTLTYLAKGGRLPRAVALAGNLLHIKPVVTLRDGVIVTSGRGRNGQAVVKAMEDMGYDPAFPVYFGYTAGDDKIRQMQQQTLAKHPDIRETPPVSIGGVIGAHVGPGAVAVGFVKK